MKQEHFKTSICIIMMAEDFYKRAQALYEEFQNKELHYQNLEKKWNSTMLNKNLSLEEQLQKINDREKDAEKTYKSGMMHAENLNRCIDQMFLKLEKLRIFGNGMRNAELPYWPSGVTASNFHEPAAFAGSSSRDILQSVCIQTENTNICAKCNSDLTTRVYQQNQFPEFNKSHISAANFQSEMDDSYQTNVLSKLPLSSTPLSTGQNILETATSPKLSDQSIAMLNKNNIFSADLNNSELVANPKLLNQDEKSPFLREETISAMNSSLMVDSSIPNRAQTFKNNDTSKDVDVTGLSAELKATVSIDAEKTRTVDVEDPVEFSKSDEGSMNHEFDFLESETPNVAKETELQVIVDLPKSPSKNSHANEEKSNAELNEVKEQVATVTRLDVAADKSDTSDSVTGPRSIPSENASIASDSDSLPEKGTPLKTSAAYQALLGNIVIPSKSKDVPPVYSDSEDEIENALANTVTKSSQELPKSSVQPKDEEKSGSSQLDQKPPVRRASKPNLGSNPQSRLSKNTRKVLGLDTSSGSDVESAVKPPGEKIEEDDEYDFYGL